MVRLEQLTDEQKYLPKGARLYDQLGITGSITSLLEYSLAKRFSEGVPVPGKRQRRVDDNSPEAHLFRLLVYHARGETTQRDAYARERLGVDPTRIGTQFVPTAQGGHYVGDEAAHELGAHLDKALHDNLPLADYLRLIGDARMKIGRTKSLKPMPWVTAPNDATLRYSVFAGMSNAQSFALPPGVGPAMTEPADLSQIGQGNGPVNRGYKQRKAANLLDEQR